MSLVGWRGQRTEMPRLLPMSPPFLGRSLSASALRLEGFSKTFQNLVQSRIRISSEGSSLKDEFDVKHTHLRFSSLLAVATVQPSGLRVLCSTRVSCAWLMSATLLKLG